MAGNEIVLRPFGWHPTERLAALAARSDPDERMSEAAEALIFKGINVNTMKTYRFQWRKFVRWCGDTGRQHLPATPATVVEWMNEMWRTPGRYGRPTSPESMELSLKVIAIVHNRAPRPEVDQNGQQLYGYVPPTKHPDVQLARRGYRKQWLEAGHRPDTAYDLSPEELTLMVETLDVRSPQGLADATLLAIGYDLGGRRVELAKLDIADIELHVVDRDNVTVDDYIAVHIAMSKTDQAGQGADVILTAHPKRFAATCPVRLVLRQFEVLAAAGFVSGPLIRVVRTGGPVPQDGRPRSGKIMDQRIDGVRVELVVARTAKNAGLLGGPGKRKHIVPHSLRAGSATKAGAEGADTPELNAHYRWSDRGTTAQRYVRRGRAKTQNPARRIWKADKPAD